MKTVDLKSSLFARFVWWILRNKPVELFYLDGKIVMAKAELCKWLKVSHLEPSLDVVLGNGGEACFKDALENKVSRGAIQRFGDYWDSPKPSPIRIDPPLAFEHIAVRKPRHTWQWVYKVFAIEPRPSMFIESAILSTGCSRFVIVRSGTKMGTPLGDSMKEWILWL